jgi:hypothetical protein
MKDNLPYIWAWGAGKVMRLAGRKGQRCKVIVRGTRNSCLIEFEDGFPRDHVAERTEEG